MSDLKRVVFLKGKRVDLCLLTEEDIPLLCKWVNDPEIRHFVLRYHPMMLENEHEWFKRLISGISKNIVLGIVVRGQLIGTMGLHGIDYVHRTATTGAAIGEKEYWGRGYGTEAKMLLLDYAFNTLNLRKINSSAISYNGRSQKYNQNCGYEIEGRRKRQFFKDGKYHDEVLLAVFKQNWLPHWIKFKAESL